ncbi:hypothetical protein [Legionella sp. W05-934-2]|uniref:hypothetical protein n=1 Tax=Legionella sp. W05-934-2 TaxID=1198649 RepID=UPI003462921E
MNINNSAIVIEAVRANTGIAYLPTYFGKHYPDLVFFMPTYWCLPKPNYITYPRSTNLLTKIHLFVEHIKNCYAEKAKE